jgi:hypothetical protein
VSDHDYNSGFAPLYDGPAVCVRQDCEFPARWMPVVEIRPSKNAEELAGVAGVFPMALLGIGLCDVHKPEFSVADVDDGGENGIHAHARRILRARRKADPDRSRTSVEWVEVVEKV